MTGEIGLVLLILLGSIILFASEHIRVDVVAMMLLLTQLFTGILTPEEAFSGFSSPAVITVWAIYIVSAGLMITGVADSIGQRIMRVAGFTEWRLVAPIAISAAVKINSVLVYDLGNFRFFDYIKVGLPLTLLIWFLLIVFLPIFWPL